MTAIGGCWGSEARLAFGLRTFPRLILGVFGRLSGRLFDQVFQRCVEAFFGIVRSGLFGRFPELLYLGLTFCHADLQDPQNKQA